MTKIDDIENPEWTQEEFRRARPAAELFPQLVSAQKPLPSTRTPVTVRLNPEIVTYFKSYGKEWQMKLNAVLMEYIAAR